MYTGLPFIYVTRVVFIFCNFSRRPYGVRRGTTTTTTKTPDQLEMDLRGLKAAATPAEPVPVYQPAEVSTTRRPTIKEEKLTQCSL
jgi:hypothetical protein